MLESEIHQEDHHSEDQRRHQDKHRRILQLAPAGPRHLLSELLVGLLQIVYELSHLSF